MERYVIHVTKACNMKCLYCYEKDKTSTYNWGEVRKTIDKILEHRTSNKFGIEFLGGEPMLAWDLIKKAYKYLEIRSEGFFTISDYIITTNGTILDDEIIAYLKKNPKLIWAASLDGHKFANQFRIMKNTNINSYDKVIENCKKLIENGVKPSVHMVTHPYNVGYLSDSIFHLYKQGISYIDIGTVESTMEIDQEYCDRFIKELDIVSKKICNGTYPDLHIGLFEWLKPKEDIRTYIKDKKTGKMIAETYGRSGNDISTDNKDFEIVRCTEPTKISDMIYNIREAVYNLHHERMRNTKAK